MQNHGLTHNLSVTPIQSLTINDDSKHDSTLVTIKKEPVAVNEEQVAVKEETKAEDESTEIVENTPVIEEQVAGKERRVTVKEEEVDVNEETKAEDESMKIEESTPVVEEQVALNEEQIACKEEQEAVWEEHVSSKQRQLAVYEEQVGVKKETKAEDESIEIEDSTLVKNTQISDAKKKKPKTRKKTSMKQSNVMNIANDIKLNLICEVCNKTFKYKYNLLHHLKIHTGEKSHACTRCNKNLLNQVH